MVNNKKVSSANKIYPIDADEQVMIKLSFDVSMGTHSIELWELDFVGRNKLLNVFEVNVNELGSYSQMMSNLKGAGILCFEL